jgi:hypothetical protein
MAGLGGLFGSGGTIEQLFIWGLLNQVISTAGAPALTLLANKVNAAHPVVPLAPPDLADSVVRNYMPLGQAEAEAALSGMNSERFALTVHLHGDAPAPGDAAIALRRGLIPEHGTGVDAVSFDQAIREGRLADKWIAMMKGLAKEWPSPVDALQAELEGQISHDEAIALYEKLGGDIQFYTWLFNSRGNAPTPVEALEMANRGIIPWDGTGPQATTYQQAFLEGPWRNKWEGPYRQLGAYVPPESTVSTLLAHGVIDDKTAAEWFSKSGMDAKTAAAFVAEAQTEALSDYRGLTIGTVLDMYYAQMIAAGDAKTILTALHVYPRAADLLLSYVDLRRAISAVTKAVSKIGTLYVGRKITKQTARQSLGSLKVPDAEANAIIADWDLEASINVKTLTGSEIVDAAFIGALTEDEAITELQNIGYTPFDAWVLLSIKAKAPLPGKPTPGAAAATGTVVPGVT